MRYFLGAVTVTMGLVCHQALAQAKPVLELSADGAELASVDVGLVATDTVEFPADYGLRPEELQASSLLMPLPPGIGGAYPEITPLTELPEPIQVVSDSDDDRITGAGIGFFQSF